MILNLTQHHATPEEISAGVRELPEDKKEKIRSLLTFNEIPSNQEIKERAEEIASEAWLIFEFAVTKERKALIGGAPFLMAGLELELLKRGIQPVYAFSKRVSTEIKTEKGIEKKSVFVFEGFVNSYF